MFTQLGPLHRRATHLITAVTVGIALLAGVSLVSAVPANAAPAIAGEIQNWEARTLCLDTPNNTAQMETCDIGSGDLNPTQFWTDPQVAAPDEGLNYLEDANGYCLGVEGSSDAQGAAVVLTSCASTPNRWWEIAYDTTIDGYDLYQIRNWNSNLCLTDDNGSTAVGTHVNQSTCTSDGATMWFWT